MNCTSTVLNATDTLITCDTSWFSTGTASVAPTSTYATIDFREEWLIPMYVMIGLLGLISVIMIFKKNYA